MPPGRVKLTAGTEAVRCLRLSNKGVLRWYTDCCRTPIANTAASPRFPVIAVVHSFMVHAGHGAFLDEVLGPPLCRIYERSAVRPLPAEAARPTVAWSLRQPRIEDIRLVGARARPAVASVRRTHERPPRSAARAHAERASRSLRRNAWLPTSVSSSDAKYVFRLE